MLKNTLNAQKVLELPQKVLELLHFDAGRLQKMLVRKFESNFTYQHSVGMHLSVEAIFNTKPCIPLGMRLLLELSIALATERCIPNGMQFYQPNERI